MEKIIHGILCPHPPIVVPEVGGNELSRVKGTIKALQAVGSSLSRSNPETLVVISPHAPMFSESVAVNTVPILRGNMGQFRAAEVEFNLENDLELGRTIAREAEDLGVPVDYLDAGFLRDNMVTDVLDHGIMVPMYYLREAGIDCPIVPIAISFLPLEQMYVFGAAIARGAAACGRQTAVLASGDLSHKLLPTAPGGYDPGGKVFDEKVQQAVRKADPTVLWELSEELIERAGQCGLRPLLMLMGALDGQRVKSVVHSYEGPFGVGYLTAEFLPRGEDPRRNFLEKIGGSKTVSELSFPAALAKKSLETYVRTGQVMPVPDDVPGEFQRPAGVFVSLKESGNLRGCIGTISPVRESAAEEIIFNAVAAGTGDPRFDPVEEDELDHLEYSVDVLGEPEPAANLDELDPDRYGVIVRRGGRSGLLLPDIEGVDSIEEQVSIAKQKAGISPFEDCEIERFEVVRYR